MKAITVHVGRGERRGPLTVFPIWQERSEGRPVVLGDDRVLRVGEMPVPAVERLQVTAIGKAAVLLLDGDIMMGGWQNRVAIGSTLIAPGATGSVTVRCVEQERWAGGKNHAVGQHRATTFVRGETDQQEVWRRVHAERRQTVRPPDIAGLVPMPGQSGVLIGIAGTPTLLELFADDTMLSAAWPRILHAAAREAAGRPDQPTYGYVARNFIGVIDKMHLHSHFGGPGGSQVQSTIGQFELRGIVDGDRLLHASVINHQAVGA